MEKNTRDAKATILARLGVDGDFPAAAKTVTMVTHLASSGNASFSDLANAILRDYGLTQKILRVVNTIAYACHNQITTISRAVALMGFEKVRSIATSLMLFDRLRKYQQADELRELINMSFYSAVLARRIAQDTGFTDAEEAFISGLFHKIGKMLVAMYLPDRYEQIKSSKETNEDTASRMVLGESYEDLGLSLASELHFPERIARSMTDHARLGPKPADEEKLACVATLSSGITAILAGRADQVEKRKGIDRLLSSYRGHISLKGKVDDLITSSLGEIQGYAAVMEMGLRGSPFVKGLDAWKPAPDASRQGAGIRVVIREADAVQSPDPSEDLPAETPEGVIARGALEIGGLITSDYSMDEVLSIVLETAYRGLGLEDAMVLFLVRDPTAPVMRLRVGFGARVDEARRWFEIPLDSSSDVFSMAIGKQSDVVVKDIGTPSAVKLLPAWYKTRVSLHRFMILLPLCIDNKPIGLFYFEGERSKSSLLSPEFLDNLKSLRDQAAHAIRRKASMGSAV